MNCGDSRQRLSVERSSTSVSSASSGANPRFSLD